MKILSVISSSWIVKDDFNQVGLVGAAQKLNDYLINNGIRVTSLIRSESKIDFFGLSPTIIQESKFSRHAVEMNKTLVKIANDYDLVIVHCTLYTAISISKMLLENELKTPFLLMFHFPVIMGIGAISGAEYLKGAIEKSKITVVAPDKVMKDLFNDFYQTDYDFNYIPNIVEDFLPEGYKVQKKSQILIVSRIEASKSIDKSIDIASSLAKDLNYDVVLVGKSLSSGKSKSIEAYDAFIRGKIENEKVKHIEYIDQQSLYKVYAESQCLVHMSKYESFGLVAVEACSVGTPTIFIESKYNGIRNLMNKDTGFMLQNFKTPDLDGAKLFLSGVDRSRIRSHYEKTLSPSAIGSRWTKLINDVCNGH